VTVGGSVSSPVGPEQSPGGVRDKAPWKIFQILPTKYE